MKTKSAVSPREIHTTVLNPERRELGVSRVEDAAVSVIAFVSMQGFTGVRRRLRGTFVHDDSFIWATLEPDAAHHDP
jgi:hypothetical protein